MQNYKLVKLNLARNSLRYIIRTYNIKKLYVPYYLCDEVRHSVVKENCEIKFYHIDNDFMPSENFSNEDYILYSNYFGICENNVEKLSKLYKNLIVDNSHAFFSKPKGFACFNSLRKFLPVYNGSYLWINDDSLQLETENIDIKIEDKIEKENSFKNSDVKYMSKFVEDELLNIDISKRKDKLNLEFINLHNKYKEINNIKIDLDSIVCPFCYPCLLKNEIEANDLVNDLQKQGYVIYRYWNNLPKSYNEYKFHSRLVPIPIQ